MWNPFVFRKCFCSWVCLLVESSQTSMEASVLKLTFSFIQKYFQNTSRQLHKSCIAIISTANNKPAGALLQNSIESCSCKRHNASECSERLAREKSGNSLNEKVCERSDFHRRTNSLKRISRWNNYFVSHLSYRLDSRINRLDFHSHCSRFPVNFVFDFTPEHPNNSWFQQLLFTRRWNMEKAKREQRNISWRRIAEALR